MLRYRNYSFIFVAFFLYFVSRFFINETLLPDYEAYKAIFYMRASNYESSGSDLFFVYFVKFFSDLNFSYEAFRLTLVSVSLFLITVSTVIFINHSKWVYITKKSDYYDLFFALILVFSFYFFLIEFYSVRLRGGLSISFFYTSLVFFIIKGRSFLLYFAFILFMSMSFGTHLTTAVTLFGFLMVPSILFTNIKFFLRYIGIDRYIKISISIIILSGFILVFGMIYFSTFRGEHLNSKLNVFRLLFISIIPMIIYFFWERKKLKKDIEVYYSLLMCDDRISLEKLSAAKEIWVHFVTIAYLGCALGLVFFYLIGMISTAGEAVIRVFTLSSIVSLLVLTLCKNKINLLWFFIVFSNSMFFLNTVFL